MWASALCKHFNCNPARIIRSVKFHYCAISNTGTGADDAFCTRLWVTSFHATQVLFVYVSTLIPSRLSDSCNFLTVLIVTRQPEQTTLLFWSAACGVTRYALRHMAFTQPTGDSRQCAPFSNLFSPLTFWPLVCLLTLCLPSPFYAPSQV